MNAIKADEIVARITRTVTVVSVGTDYAVLSIDGGDYVAVSVGQTLTVPPLVVRDAT